LSVASAIRADDPSALPSRRDEDWRWTDLRGLIRVVPPPSARPERPVPEGGPFKGLGDIELTIANGHLNWWPDPDIPGPVRVHTHDAPEAPFLTAGHPMASRAARNGRDPRISIISFDKDGTALLRFVSDGGGSHDARVGVMVPAGVRAKLLESYEGRGDGYLANYLIEVFLGEGAELERVVVADEAAEGVSVSTAEIHLKHGASFAQTVVASGARRQRIETRVAHPGGGAKLRLDGVYLLEGKRHADLTTVVEHKGADGVTAQLTKGVVRDQSRGVFQGRIVVAQGADRTDARMEHHALILGDRAEVDAKPELEIYADDVACSHGNTIGALDQDALFYARQRGIPEPGARALLTEAFIGEVVDRIWFEGAREVVRQWAGDRLRRT